MCSCVPSSLLVAGYRICSDCKADVYVECGHETEGMKGVAETLQDIADLEDTFVSRWPRRESLQHQLILKLSGEIQAPRSRKLLEGFRLSVDSLFCEFVDGGASKMTAR